MPSFRRTSAPPRSRLIGKAPALCSWRCPLNGPASRRLRTDWIFRFDESPAMEYLAPGVEAERSWNYNGVLKEELARAWLSGRFRKAQAGFHGQYTTNSERFDGSEYQGLYLWHMCANARPSDLIVFGGYVNHGHQVFYHGLFETLDISSL